MSSILLTTAMSICFVAGKSGGHLLPCITEAKNIYTQNPKAELYIFSSGSDLDKTIIEKHPYISHYIPTAIDNPPYGKPWLLPWFTCKTIWYFCKSLYKLRTIKPQKVISFGGFISIPVCLAAKLLGIPFEVYELNVEPGKATVFLSKFTDHINTCFQTTKNYLPKTKCIHFDYPIRFQQQDLIFNKSQLLQQYHFSQDRMTLLVLGGSQGSILLNDVVKNMVQDFPELQNKIQIIHQTGKGDPFDYEKLYQSYGIPAYVFGYHEKLQDCYNLADLIISRAGSGTLFEIKFFGKRCITIPHETANTNHQIKNVLELQKEFPEQFSIIKQADFTPQILMEQILKAFHQFSL